MDLEESRTVEMDSGEFGELKGTVRAILEGMAGDRTTSDGRRRSVEDRRKWILRIGIPALMLALGGGSWKTSDILDNAESAEEVKVKAEADRIETVDTRMENLAGAIVETRKTTSEGLLKLGEKIDAASPAAAAIEMPASVKAMAAEAAEVERKQEAKALMNGDAK